MRNGKAVFRSNEQFTGDQLLPRTARSAIGQLADGRFLLVTVDGSQPGYSAGATNFELALLMVKLGAVTAAGLDSGRSAAMAFDGTPAQPAGWTRSARSPTLCSSSTRASTFRRRWSQCSLAERGRGRREQHLAYKVVRPSNVTASLIGPDGAPRYSFTGPVAPGTYPLDWPGTTPDGTPEAEGTWRWLVSATDDAGVESSTERTFQLNDTLGFASPVGPTLAVPRARPRAVATFKLTRAATVAPRIETTSGVVLRTLPKQQATAGDVEVSWDGVTDSGALVYPGRYTAEVTATNELGSVTLGRRLLGPARGREDAATPAAGEARQIDSPGAPFSNTCPALLKGTLMLVASITHSVTSFVGNHGLYAVFVLMLIDAVFPAASELVMIYGGALAAGALTGGHVVLFGNRIDSAAWGYVAVSLAGTIGYLIGSILGWGIGAYGGRPLLERRGRWLHLSPEQARPCRSLVRAPRRLGGLPRAGDTGRALVHLDPGRRLPFSAPPLHAADARRLGDLGFAFAGAGWGVGTGYRRVHEDFRWVDYAVIAAVCDRRGVVPPPPTLAQNRPAVTTPLVDVKAQYAPLIPELKERFAEVLESGRFILGPNVAAFEEEAAAYLGVPATVGVGNGTDALVLVLDAMGIGPGDEVICPAFTFYATAEAIVRRGATPVFADIEPATLNLDPGDVAARITPRTSAIMPVHLFGRPGAARRARRARPAADRGRGAGVRRGRDRDHWRRLDLQLLPDQEPVRRSATAVSSRRPTRSSPNGFACSASTARATRSTSIWSATTRASTSSRRRRCASSCPSSTAGTAHGARRRRDTPSSGSAMCASCPPTSRGTSTTCTSVRTPERDRLAAALTEAGIASAAYYVTPLHLQPALRFLGYEEGSLPETERASRENLALPLWAGIDAGTQERVVTVIREASAVGAAR